MKFEPSDKKIKILYLVDGFRLGGAESKLLELIGHLDKEKYDIHICNNGPDGPLRDQFEALGLPILDYPRRHAMDHKSFFPLLRFLRNNKIDILQNTLFYADVAGALAGRLAKIPAIVSWETVSHEGNHFHQKLHQRVGYRWAMRHTDTIVAVSNEIKTSLLKHRGIPAEKIKVIHYGVDIKKFSLNGQSSVRSKIGLNGVFPVVGVVGRLEEVKGHRYLLQALAEVVKKNPKLKCLFIGDGPYRANLEDLVEKLNLKSKILFLGFRSDVAELLHAIDFLVLPSISEGLPNVILEAMASGKPVIGSEVGGIPEVITHKENGLLVPPKQSDALVDSITFLLNDRNRLQRFSARARESIEQSFSLDLQIKGFEQVYQNLFHKNQKLPIPS